MTLNPHAIIFKPTNCSRLFTKYRRELVTEMDASTSQGIIFFSHPCAITCNFSGNVEPHPISSQQAQTAHLSPREHLRPIQQTLVTVPPAWLEKALNRAL